MNGRIGYNLGFGTNALVANSVFISIDGKYHRVRLRRDRPGIEWEEFPWHMEVNFHS